jgi:hypothetical protein
MRKYKAHLKAANTWGNTWFTIADNIHETIKKLMSAKYRSLDRKLQSLSEKVNNTNPQTYTTQKAKNTNT